VKSDPPTSLDNRRFRWLTATRPSTPFHLVWFGNLLWFGWCLALAGCGSSPSTTPPPTESAARSPGEGGFAACVSPSSPHGLPVGLAVHSVERTSNGTILRIVAYTTSRPGVLQLPLYTMSRGRWSIGEMGRAFLLDQECRSYPLLDVTFDGPRIGPGQIRLAPRQSLDGTLHFPPLTGRSPMALLVYDTVQIPFLVPPQPRSAVGPLPSSDASPLPR